MLHVTLLTKKGYSQMKRVITLDRLQMFINQDGSKALSLDGHCDIEISGKKLAVGVRARFGIKDDQMPQALVPACIFEDGPNGEQHLGLFASENSDTSFMVHTHRGHQIEIDTGTTEVRFSNEPLKQRDGKPITVNAGGGNMVPVYGLEGLTGDVLKLTHMGVVAPAGLAPDAEVVKFSGTKILERKQKATAPKAPEVPAAAPAIP